MLNLCEEFVRQEVDPRSCSPKIGIFWRRTLDDAMRADIEHRVDIDAIDIYGQSEVIGPGVACECIEAKEAQAAKCSERLPVRTLVRHDQEEAEITVLRS